MPLFLSDEEFSRCSNDAATVAEKADAFIRSLLNELETVKAKADASDIDAEQTCSFIEQKYLSLAAEFSKLESRAAELQVTLDQRLAELAEVQTQKEKIDLQSIEKDREIERLKSEVSELHKSKRQLIELNEQKDLQLSEKNAAISSSLYKIANLSENAAQKDCHVSELEAELARSRAERTRLSQVQRQLSECSKSLQWNKDRARELEMKLKSAHEEPISAKDSAAANEQKLYNELSTSHLKQFEDDYKQKPEKESATKRQFEKEAAEFESCEGEIERSKKNEGNLVPHSGFSPEKDKC